jgi:hypothetical protein
METRQHPRVVVDCEVACEASGQRSPVFMYDLSLGGCMFECGDALPLQIGQDVILTLASSLHPAEVVWAVGQCVGAQFRQVLPAVIVTHYGFSPDTTRFEALAPRDRFGRLLPPLSKRCG